MSAAVQIELQTARESSDETPHCPGYGDRLGKCGQEPGLDLGGLCKMCAVAKHEHEHDQHPTEATEHTDQALLHRRKSDSAHVEKPPNCCQRCWARAKQGTEYFKGNPNWVYLVYRWFLSLVHFFVIWAYACDVFIQYGSLKGECNTIESSAHCGGQCGWDSKNGVCAPRKLANGMIFFVGFGFAAFLVASIIKLYCVRKERDSTFVVSSPWLIYKASTPYWTKIEKPGCLVYADLVMLYIFFIFGSILSLSLKIGNVILGVVCLLWNLLCAYQKGYRNCGSS